MTCLVVFITLAIFYFRRRRGRGGGLFLVCVGEGVCVVMW